MSLMELWASWCHSQDLSFKVFCVGCDLLLGAHGEVWAQRGFPAVRDEVWRRENP